MLTIGQQHVAGIRYSDQPAIGHFEEPELVGGAKAMLDGSHHSQWMQPITFKGHHGVDDVLQQTWAGNVAILGDVPNENHGHVAGFRFLYQSKGTFAHLRDGTRG